MRFTHARNLLELATNRRDALAYHATVDLKLAFALAEARAHAAAHAIARQVRPHAAQTRQQVLVLRQTHLQTTLFRGGMQRENIKDERRSINDLHIFRYSLFQIALLRRCEFIVENHDISRIRMAHLGDFFRLARPDECARIRRIELLVGGRNHFGARRVGQTRELFKRRRERRGIVALELNANENGAFATLVHRRK